MEPMFKLQVNLSAFFMFFWLHYWLVNKNSLNIDEVFMKDIKYVKLNDLYLIKDNEGKFQLYV